MTSAARSPQPAGGNPVWRPSTVGAIAVRPRLLLLHLLSRRAPAALIVVAVSAGILRLALDLHWVASSGPGAQQLPLVLVSAIAVVIAAAARSPFCDPERTTGGQLACLRLITAVALTGVAVCILSAAVTAARLPGGTLDILRNVAGLTGIGLLAAAALGGMLAWAGPVAYLVMAEYALTAAWQTPWIWPARPPHDRGAALCATGVFAAGIAVITIRGARDVSD
jgi:hypothetical protein